MLLRTVLVIYLLLFGTAALAAKPTTCRQLLEQNFGGGYRGGNPISGDFRWKLELAIRQLIQVEATPESSRSTAKETLKTTHGVLQSILQEYSAAKIFSKAQPLNEREIILLQKITTEFDRLASQTGLGSITFDLPDDFWTEEPFRTFAPPFEEGPLSRAYFYDSKAGGPWRRWGTPAFQYLIFDVEKENFGKSFQDTDLSKIIGVSADRSGKRRQHIVIAYLIDYSNQSLHWTEWHFKTNELLNWQWRSGLDEGPVRVQSRQTGIVATSAEPGSTLWRDKDGRYFANWSWSPNNKQDNRR